MAYTAEQSDELCRQCAKIAADLQSLNFEGLSQSQALENKDVRAHLRHGAGRRLGILKAALEGIFKLFPPSRLPPLSKEALTEVQIYLHAFVINVAGVFDNWAWAFIFRHELRGVIGNYRSVGLFRRETQRLLPASLREYLTSEAIAAWHANYLKGYRDALAHRIPLYIPPASWTPTDEELYERLELEKIECIREQQWERLDEVWARQDVIGTVCPVFMHEFSPDERARPVFLHPQIISDSITVVDFGRRFYQAWHECTPDM